jgi:hypothetical protein
LNYSSGYLFAKSRLSYNSGVENGVIVLGNQGLGDQIVMKGIYSYYASLYEKCVIPVCSRYKSSIVRMTKDIDNVFVVGYRMEIWHPSMLAHRDFLSNRGFTAINLGIFANTESNLGEIPLDEKIFLEAKVNHDLRWENFQVLRNTEKERELFISLGCHTGRYVFVHEDIKRGLSIDEEKLPKGIKIIRPSANQKKFSIFDYIYILENAAEIHCIESSFAILIEQLNLNVRKYIHRYARPEVESNPEFHYSFRSDWTILKSSGSESGM